MPPTPYRRHGVTTCGVLSWRGGFLSNFMRISGSGLHSMGSRHFGWWVTRVVVRLVDMFEVAFRQILAFNEEALLQAASATCRHVTGRCVRGVVSSDFCL